LRFSVRGLIILVLLIGLWLGWLARSVRIQRNAVAAIEKAGGSVNYDWEYWNANEVPSGLRWVRTWLADLIGADYFANVAVVWFPPTATAPDFEQVGRLTGLVKLILEQCPLSNAELVHLKGMTRLSMLWLGETRLTDAGLVHLKGLTGLTCLDLGGTQVTDAGLVHLKGLTRLSSLNLSATQVTDAGLVHLKGLKGLELLDLSDTQVTDAGLVALKGLSKLFVLEVGDTQVTDAGMKQLSHALPMLNTGRIVRHRRVRFDPVRPPIAF
jgi:hypothetical protein